jgi:RND family efflux transporter MFP subunit
LTAALPVLAGEDATIGSDGSISTEGLLTPYREIKLAVESDGVIIETPVEEGDKVSRGQVLGRLDDRQAVLRERAFRAVSEKRQGDLASLKKLFNEKVASRNDVEKAQVEADTASAELESAKMELEKRHITSPIDGFILRRYKDVGESIQRLENYAELIDTSRVSVIVYLPAEHIHRVKEGNSAQVQIPLLRPEPFTGTVEMVDPVVDPGAGIFRAKIVVPNEDGSIVTGTRARVVIAPAA